MIYSDRKFSRPDFYNSCDLHGRKAALGAVLAAPDAPTHSRGRPQCCLMSSRAPRRSGAARDYPNRIWGAWFFLRDVNVPWGADVADGSELLFGAHTNLNRSSTELQLYKDTPLTQNPHITLTVHSILFLNSRNETLGDCDHFTLSESKIHRLIAAKSHFEI